jgi:hypothetical protein
LTIRRKSETQHKRVNFKKKRTGVGGSGVEGSGFGLRNFLNLTIQLTSGRLVKAHLLLEARGTNGIQHAKDTDSVTVGSILGHVKRNLDMTHGSQVINLRRFNIGDYANEVGGIAQVAIVQKKLYSGFVAILVQVVNAARVEARRTTHDPVHLSSEKEKKVSEKQSLRRAAGNRKKSSRGTGVRCGVIIGFHGISKGPA